MSRHFRISYSCGLVIRGLLCALGVAALSPRAMGVPLVPGGSVATTGTNYSATIVADVDRSIALLPDVCPFVCDPIGNITIRDRVTRLASGTYNFERYFQQGSSIPSSDLSIVESDFAGFATDVDFDPTTLQGISHPTSADRSASGDTVNFRAFSDPIGLNEHSDFMTIQTDATSYDATGLITVHLNIGSAAFHGLTDAFTPAVPEPSSALLLAGMGALLAFGRRLRSR